MAWAFVAVGTVGTTTTTTLTLNSPAGVAEGDLLVACISGRGYTSGTGWCSSPPTGWTYVTGIGQANTSTNTSALGNGSMFYIQRGASAPSFVFTLTGTADSAMGYVVAYRPDAGSKIILDVSTAVATGTNTTSVNVAGMTTVRASTLLVGMTAGGQEAAWSAFKSANAPSTASSTASQTGAPSTTAWLERADGIFTTGADTSVAIFDAVKTATGATGNFTATASLGAGHVVIAAAFAMYVPTLDGWDSGDISASMTLSNSDRTVTSAASGARGVRGGTTRPVATTGSFYFEFTHDGQIDLIGMMATGQSLTLTTTENTAVKYDGTPNVENTTFTTIGSFYPLGAAVIGVAVKLGSTRNIWYRINGNNWNSPQGGDPLTDTGGYSLASITSTNIAPWAYSSLFSGSVTTLRAKGGDQTYLPPSGFKTWVGETSGGWSSFDKTATITLSNSDKTATFPVAGLFTGVRSTTTHPSGTAAKYYAEFLFTTVVGEGNCYVGLKNATDSVTLSNTGAACASDGNCYWQGATVANMSTAFANGDVACMAWDAGGEKIWFRKNSGNWNGNATHNPATGAGGIDMSAAANVAHSLWSYNQSDTVARVVVIRTTLAEYTQTPPAGFLSWMGEPVPEATGNKTFYITNTLDDGRWAPDVWSPLGTDLRVGYDGGLNQLARRFQNIPIPYRSRIISATLKIGGTSVSHNLTTPGDAPSVYGADPFKIFEDTYNSTTASFTVNKTQITAANKNAIDVTDIVTEIVRKSAYPVTHKYQICFTSQGPSASVCYIDYPGSADNGQFPELTIQWDVPAGTPGAWNHLTKPANITLSNGDKTATGPGTSGYLLVRATEWYTTGKRYFETTLNTKGSFQAYVGIATSDYVPFTTGSGAVIYETSGSVYNQNAVSIGTIEAYTSGDTISVAVDVALSKVWFRKNGGLWNNSASDNPATNTGGFTTTADIFIYAISILNQSGVHTLKAGPNAAFSYSVPSGFVAWDGSAPPPDVSVSATGIALAITAGTAIAAIPLRSGWNFNDTTANITLSNSDRTATATAAAFKDATQSTEGHASGVWYAEITVDVVSGYVAIGALTADFSGSTFTATAGFLYQSSGDVTDQAGSLIANIGSYAAGDVISVAIDADTGKVWFRKNAGNWNNGGVGYTYTAGPALHLTAVLPSTTNKVTLNTGLLPFSYTVPPTYLDWYELPPTLVNATTNLLTAYVGDVTIKIAARANVPGQSLSVGTAGIGGPQFVFGGFVPDGLGGFASEFGTKVTFAKDGRITHIRYWRDPNNVGTARTTKLWAMSSEFLLASATGANDGAITGWVNGDPLNYDVTAGVQYVVSVNVPTSYSFTDLISFPYTKDDVTALTGMYSPSVAGVYPTNAIGYNLFIEPVFRAFSAEEVVTTQAKPTAATNLATITAGTVTVTAKQTVSVNAATNLLTTTVGTVTAGVSARGDATTNLLTAATSTPTVVGKANVNATTNLATVTLGNESIVGKANVDATTNLLTLTEGDETTSGKASTTATTNLATMTAGTVTVVGKGNTSALTNLATISVGTVNVDQGGAVLWTPATLGADLIAWYDYADASTVFHSGGFLTEWRDKSGNARHGIASSTGTLAVNSDGIYIANATSGANLVIQMPTLPSAYFDLAFAGKPNAAGSYRTLLANKAGSYHHVLLETGTNNLGTYNGATGFTQPGTLTWPSVDGQVYFVGPSATGIKIGRDGNAPIDEVGENFTPDADPALLNYGTAGGQGFGTAREFVFMTASMSQAIQDKVSGYLAWKWDGLLGITTHVTALPAGHPYKTGAPMTGAVHATANATTNVLTTSVGTVTITATASVTVTATTNLATISIGTVAAGGPAQTVTISSGADDGYVYWGSGLPASYTWDDTYMETAEDTYWHERTGWRFPGFLIPTGQRAIDAKLTIPLQDYSVANSGYIIGVAVDNAPVWSDTNNPETVAKTNARVKLDTDYDVVPIPVFNVTDAINEIITRPGWASGNAIAFATGGPYDPDEIGWYVGFYGVEDSQPASLHIEWGIDDPSVARPRSPPMAISIGTVRVGISTGSQTFPITNTNDDGSWDQYYIDLGLTGMRQGEDGAGNDYRIVLRWRDMPIAQGSRIISAVLTLRSDTSSGTNDGSNQAGYIHGAAEDNCGPWVQYTHDPGSTPYTTARSAFIAPVTSVFTTDVRTSVQEVISRPGWLPGNALGLMGNGPMDGVVVGSGYVIHLYDSFAHPGDEAKLAIAWEPPVPASVNVTGNLLTATAGTVTVIAKQNVLASATTNLLTATVGNVTVTANQKISVNATGNSLAITAGTATVAVHMNVLAASQFALISTGNVTVTGKAVVNATTNLLTTTAGTAITITGTFVLATGNQMTVTAGDETVRGDAKVYVTTAGVATGPASSLLTTFVPGAGRNDFTGEVGVRYGIAGADITMTWLGTYCGTGSGTRTVRINEWFADANLRTVTVDMAGKTPGTWVWTAITPLTLLANGYYSVLQEVTASDGLQWSNADVNAIAIAGSEITNLYSCYRIPAGGLNANTLNAMYVGLDIGTGSAGGSAGTSLTMGLGDELVRAGTSATVTAVPALAISTALPGGVTVSSVTKVFVTGNVLNMGSPGIVYVPHVSPPHQREGRMLTMANLMGN